MSLAVYSPRTYESIIEGLIEATSSSSSSCNARAWRARRHLGCHRVFLLFLPPLLRQTGSRRSYLLRYERHAGIFVRDRREITVMSAHEACIIDGYPWDDGSPRFLIFSPDLPRLPRAKSYVIVENFRRKEFSSRSMRRRRRTFLSFRGKFLAAFGIYDGRGIGKRAGISEKNSRSDTN